MSQSWLYKIISKLRPRLLKFRRNRWTMQFARNSECGADVRINGDGKVLDAARLVLGANVHIGGNYFIDARGEIEIGDNTHISRNLVCYSANHDYEGVVLPYDNQLIRKKVIIERNVWIGMNVCIVPGVTIGEGAVIAMGAVVNKDVPPLAIVGGNPAKTLKFRDKEHYNKLEGSKLYGGINGMPLATCHSLKHETSDK